MLFHGVNVFIIILKRSRLQLHVGHAKNRNFQTFFFLDGAVQVQAWRANFNDICINTTYCRAFSSRNIPSNV